MTDKKMKEEEKKYQMAVLQENAEALERQILMINEELRELKTAKVGLDSLQNTKKDTELLIPLGAGVFIKGNLIENKKIVMDIGSETFVDGEIKDAEKELDKKIAELEKIKMDSIGKMQQTANVLAGLQNV